MKNNLQILIVLLITLLLSACIGDNIANIDEGVGSIIISGRWSGEMSNKSSSISRTIYSEAGSIEVTLTKDSQEISQTETRTSDSTSFYIVMDDVEIGDWTMTLIIYDYDGQEVGRTSESVSVNSGDNPVDLLVTPNDYSIGPANYAELFLPDKSAENYSLFSCQYEIMSYLDIEEIDLYTADAYVRSDVYNNHTDFFSKNQIFCWNWPNITGYEEGREDVDSTYISSNSDVAATMKYTYSDEYIVAATYSNEADFTENVIVTYNDSGKISQVESLTEKGTSTSNEKLTYSYENGILTVVESEVGNGTPKTLEYNDGYLTSNIEKDSDGNKVSEQTYTWNSSELSTFSHIEYDVNDYDGDSNTSEIRWQRDATYTYDEGKLKEVMNTDKILLSGYETDEKKVITYSYNSNDGLSSISIVKYYYEDSLSDYNEDDEQGFYESNKVDINFTYDDDNLVRKVSYNYTTYDYIYNSGTLEYERTDTENEIFYEKIYYTSDSGSDVTIGVQ